jgi:hypothetical protein
MSNGKTLVMNLKGFGRKQPWTMGLIFQYLSGISDRGKNCQYSLCLNYGSNQSPPEYKLALLPLGPQFLV